MSFCIPRAALPLLLQLCRSNDDKPTAKMTKVDSWTHSNGIFILNLNYQRQTYAGHIKNNNNGRRGGGGGRRSSSSRSSSLKCGTCYGHTLILYFIIAIFLLFVSAANLLVVRLFYTERAPDNNWNREFTGILRVPGACPLQ